MYRRLQGRGARRGQYHIGGREHVVRPFLNHADRAGGRGGKVAKWCQEAVRQIRRTSDHELYRRHRARDPFGCAHQVRQNQPYLI